MDGGLLKEASDRLLISKGQNNSSLLDGVDGGLLKEASDWLLISRGQNNGSPIGWLLSGSFSLSFQHTKYVGPQESTGSIVHNPA